MTSKQPRKKIQPIVEKPAPVAITTLPAGGSIAFKMDRILMEYPLFSASTHLVHEKTHFRFGDIEFTIKPGADGQATVHDSDILRYIMAKLVERRDRGEPISPVINITAHDLLLHTKRSTGKRGYELLLEGFRRLAGTRIETNVPAPNGQVFSRDWGWLSEWETLGDVDEQGKLLRLKSIQVTLAPWLFAAIEEKKRLLAFNADYFSLRRPTDRRLYDLARKFCGRQPEFRIGLSKLHQRMGATQPLRNFRQLIERAIREDSIPDYTFEIVYARVDKETLDYVKPAGFVRRLDNLLVIIRPKKYAITDAPFHVVEADDSEAEAA